jgi:site-specific recombinase XerD
MSTELDIALQRRGTEGLEHSSGAALRYAVEAAASNTRRAYRADWANFTAWCAENGREALPASPVVLADYLAHLADSGLKASTIVRRCSGIARAHRLAGHRSPLQGVAKETLSGIRRTLSMSADQVAPITVAELRRIVQVAGEGLHGTRDRALLLIGFAGALRRSELVGLDVGDLRSTEDGYVLTVRRSKTDQEGAGRTLGIPYGSRPETCPVRALRRWLELAAIAEGPVFRPIDRHDNVGDERLSDRAVALRVQELARRAGLDPSRYAGHSLRSGLATAAAAAGVSENDIARTTGHRSVVTLRRYVRPATVFERNAASAVGL